MWSLPEDPKYSHGLISEWSKHQNKVAFNADEKDPPVTEEVVAWNKLTRNDLMSTYGSLLL